jgi:hypothetical protein
MNPKQIAVCFKDARTGEPFYMLMDGYPVPEVGWAFQLVEMYRFPSHRPVETDEEVERLIQDNDAQITDQVTAYIDRLEKA